MPLTNFMKGGEELISQSEVPLNNVQEPSGYLKRIRVLLLTKGKRESNLTTLLYYGLVADLTFDPKQYEWKDGFAMMTYLAKKGRDVLRQKTPPINLAESKWAGVLPAHFNFDWKKLWDRTRARKESMLIWLMWHHGVAVNAWRHSINAEFNGDSGMCHPGVEESILHHFWHCPFACHIWDWATSLFHKLRMRRTHFSPWPALEMTQLIFTEELPARL
jgi:hypothetical protein